MLARFSEQTDWVPFTWVQTPGARPYSPQRPWAEVWGLYDLQAMRVHVAEKVEDVDESNKDAAQVGPTEEAPAKERRAPVPRFRSSWTGGSLKTRLNSIHGFCTDAGTEMSIADVAGIKIKDVLPDWMQDPLAESQEASDIESLDVNHQRPAQAQAPPAAAEVWQWEHRTGFKNYDTRATARIEDAFQRGLSRVRLKAGKMDDTPMELFFHDMIQFDPKTGNTRKIRRVGRDSCWKKLRRKANELAWLIETGRTQRVVFAQYEKKRKELHRSFNGD
ncbi:hypothetical protein AK812_SmicGene17261 [Symbiodinium microadriaticum]|uniref:WWE domain-containing protein n=1 Tax=Symbiodinium microadriaticum TaxID=2951 RepID=A0A1Q9DY73_SYMMI|nr:hypothetical protein AK812_SmicGene17261 [Symbiodinium microadriaticum]